MNYNPIKIHFSDAKLEVLFSGDADSNNKDFTEFARGELYQVGAFLTSNGWEIKIPYEEDSKHSCEDDMQASRWVSELRRVGIKDRLELEIEINSSPNSLRFSFWEDVNDHTNEHRYGGKFINKKETAMPYRQKCRCYAARAQLKEYFESMAKGQIDVTFDKNGILQKELSVEERLRLIYKRSPNKNSQDVWCPSNGECKTQPSNVRSANGDVIKQGAVVWGRSGRTGRWVQGRAAYGLNSSWYILSGKCDIHLVSNTDIYTVMPENELRQRVSNRTSIKNLDRLIDEAAGRREFLTAQRYLEAQQRLEKEVCA